MSSLREAISKLEKCEAEGGVVIDLDDECVGDGTEAMLGENDKTHYINVQNSTLKSNVRIDAQNKYTGIFWEKSLFLGNK